MPTRREFRLCKPITRELLYSIRDILSAKDAEAQHLFWRKLGFEIGVKFRPNWLDKQIAVPALHLIVNDDRSLLHGRQVMKRLRDGRQHNLADHAGRRDPLIGRIIVAGCYGHDQIEPGNT